MSATEAVSGLPLIVLLHGCGGSPEEAFIRTGWLNRIEHRGRHAIALRLPGHGQGCSHDPADYSDLAGHVLAALPDGEVDLVGFSLGAKLALAIAMRAPERVRRLVLGGVGDNVFAPEVIGEAAARALEHGPDETTPPPVLSFLQTWDPTLNDSTAIAAVLRRPANPTFAEEAIHAVSTPTLLVNGSEDIVGKLGRRLAHALRPDEIIVAGIDHFGLTASAEFIAAAIEFLTTAVIDEQHTEERHA